MKITPYRRGCVSAENICLLKDPRYLGLNPRTLRKMKSPVTKLNRNIHSYVSKSEQNHRLTSCASEVMAGIEPYHLMKNGHAQGLLQDQMGEVNDSPDQVTWDRLRNTFSHNICVTPNPRRRTCSPAKTCQRDVPYSVCSSSHTSTMGIQCSMFHCRECKRHIKYGKSLERREGSESDSESSNLSEHLCPCEGRTAGGDSFSEETVRGTRGTVVALKQQKTQQNSDNVSDDKTDADERKVNECCSKESLKGDDWKKEEAQDGDDKHQSDSNIKSVKSSYWQVISFMLVLLCAVVSVYFIQQNETGSSLKPWVYLKVPYFNKRAAEESKFQKLTRILFSFGSEEDL